MSDDMEIDPHTYVITHAPVIRCFPSPGGMIADGTVVEDAVSSTRYEMAIPVAIQPTAKPPGYDWRAAQARVPRNGKTKTQWSRRHV